MKLLKNIGTLALAVTCAAGIASCTKAEPINEPKSSDYKCERMIHLSGLNGAYETEFFDFNGDCVIDAETVQLPGHWKYLTWIAPEFEKESWKTGGDKVENFTKPYSDKIRLAATKIAHDMREYEFANDMAKYQSQQAKK